MGGDSTFSPEKENIFRGVKYHWREGIMLSARFVPHILVSFKDKHIKNVWKNSDCKGATHNDNFIIKSRHTVDLKNHASALHALVVVHSGAINSSDMATSKKAIYSTFGSGRTKTTYILQHGLSLAAKEILLRNIGD